MLSWVCVVIISLATATLWSRVFDLSDGGPRVETIDGLRGYLAIGVFVHHFWIWEQYLTIGAWRLTPSVANTHLGQAGVILFFMITAYLFGGKILAAPGRVSFLRIYVGRLARLFALYLFVIVLLVLIVLGLSDWQPRVDVLEGVRQLMKWLLFTIPGAPSLNNYTDTELIVASVVWTLRYEWLFYVSLPFFFLIKPAFFIEWINFVALVALFLVVLHYVRPQLLYLLPFMGGIFSVWVSGWKPIRALAVRPVGSILAVFLLSLLGFFQTSYGVVPILLLTIFFLLIASGCDVFGLLRWTSSRYLGSVTYSVYLLHGMLLFVFVRLIAGEGWVMSLGRIEYFGLALVLAPILVTISVLTYIFVEKPGIRLGRQCVATDR